MLEEEVYKRKRLNDFRASATNRVRETIRIGRYENHTEYQHVYNYMHATTIYRIKDEDY